MITATFTKKNGNFYKFRISGHSGYAESGSDIVCAAVSSMTMLTINTVNDGFGVPVDLSVDEATATIDFSLCTPDERACALIAGLEKEISALANDYPKNVRVVIK
jgi:uncharacterized protein YsxB (DUF464 family)